MTRSDPGRGGRRGRRGFYYQDLYAVRQLLLMLRGVFSEVILEREEDIVCVLRAGTALHYVQVKTVEHPPQLWTPSILCKPKQKDRPETSILGKLFFGKAVEAETRFVFATNERVSKELQPFLTNLGEAPSRARDAITHRLEPWPGAVPVEEYVRRFSIDVQENTAEGLEAVLCLEIGRAASNSGVTLSSAGAESVLGDLVSFVQETSRDEAASAVRRAFFEAHFGRLAADRRQVGTSPGPLRKIGKADVLLYLEAVRTSRTRLPPWHTHPHQLASEGAFTALRQAVSVTRGPLRFDHAAASPGSLEVLPGARRHQEILEQRLDVMPWTRAREEARAAVVLADPGLGKTWLLNEEARFQSQVATSKLRAGSADVVIPLWVNVAAWRRVVDGDDVRSDDLAQSTPEHSLVWTACDELGMSSDISLRKWLDERLCTGEVVVLLDGWDEVAGVGRSTLRKHIDVLARRSRESAGGRLLITSRPTGFSPPFSFTKSDQIWELTALSPDDSERLFDAWLGPESEARQQIHTAIAQSASLQALVRVPLLAGFLCAVAAEGDVPKTRAGLYEQVLERLLRGWRETDSRVPQLDEGLTDAKLEVLEDIAWATLTRPGDSSPSITVRNLRRVLAASGAADELRQAAIKDRSLAAELTQHDGMLVPVGAPQPGHGSLDVPYTFIHPSLREYLVARKLSRRYTDDHDATVLFEVAERSWLDPSWAEVIPLMAARIAANAGDPLPLVRALWNVVELEEDVFHWNVFLIASLLPELHGKTDEVEDLVVRRLDEIHSSRSYSDRLRAIRALGLIGSRRAVYLLRTYEAKALGERREEVSRALSGAWRTEGRALTPAGGSMTAASTTPTDDPFGDSLTSPRQPLERDRIDALLAVLQDERRPGRPQAARALGQARVRRAVGPLVVALRDRRPVVRKAAAEALLLIGGPTADGAIRKALDSGDPAVEAVVDLMLVKRDGTPDARGGALRPVLGRPDGVGDEASVPAGGEPEPPPRSEATLLENLRASDTRVRRASAEELARRETVEPSTALADAFEDLDPWVRESMACAMGKTRSERFVPLLIEALQDGHRWTRCAAAEALGRIGATSAIDALAACLATDDPPLQAAAAAALVSIGSDQALDVIVPRLDLVPLPARDPFLATRPLDVLTRIALVVEGTVPALLSTFYEFCREGALALAGAHLRPQLDAHRAELVGLTSAVLAVGLADVDPERAHEVWERACREFPLLARYTETLFGPGGSLGA